MTLIIDLPKARALIAEAIEAKGADYITPTVCRYFGDDGAPACIVGVALAPYGLTLDMVETARTGLLGDPSVLQLSGWGGGEGRGFSGPFNDVFQLTKEAATYLNRAQSWQDDGAMWSRARDEAETWAANHAAAVATTGDQA